MRISPKLLNNSLVGLLAGAGTLHLIPRTAKNFDALVPQELPGSQRAWTIGSGVLELTTAALLAMPNTRATGAAAAAALFIGVFPGNVKMAWDWRTKSAPMQVISYGRLPLQVPLVWAALKVREAELHKSEQ